MTTKIWRPPPRSLADVRDPDGDKSYPNHILDGAETALIMFCAAFWGRQDAYHVAAHGLHGTCVDTDGAKLEEMRAVYPAGWEFHEQDAFAFTAQAVMEERQWDIVSLDPFTDKFDRCADLVETWCGLATRAVLLGTGEYTVMVEPEGWRVTERRKRSDFHGGIYWTVLEPC